MGLTNLRFTSRTVHGSRGFDPHTGAISFPIYQCATFRHPGLGESSGYDYTRSENPTREQVESLVANLEGGEYGFAFSSGMAAISTVLELFRPGDHLVVSDDLYGGSYRLFEEISRGHGLEFTYVDSSNIENANQAIQNNTRAFFVETPSNPMMKVTDIRALVELARSRHLATIIDNTFFTPYLQRPLELGADIVVHSGTKFLSGHNDTLAGFIVLNNEEMAERIRLVQKSVGAVLAPFDSWLVLRGLKTLALRVDKQQQNAIIVAQWLQDNDQVEKVYFVGLPEHDGYDVCKSQASGFGAMISFSLKDAALVPQVLNRVELIAFAESLGGVESLITYPVTQTHAAIPENIRQRLGVNDKLLRLSIGIEDVEDIIADLEWALS